jgi:hypothetical protein
MSQALERRPTAATALGGFAGYVIGMLFVMASTFLMIASLAMLVDGAWGGWPGRAAGSGLTVTGAAIFAAGRWLMEECAVQQRQPHSAVSPPKPASQDVTRSPNGLAGTVSEVPICDTPDCA